MDISTYKNMTTIKEASKILGISEYSLRQGIKQGLYPYNKVGKKHLINISLMVAFLEQEAYKNMTANQSARRYHEYI